MPADTPRITDLRAESLVNPLGLDEPRPRLSWITRGPADARGGHQTARRILVASTLDALEREEGDLWDSGKVQDDRSIEIAYEGAALVSRQRGHWKVRVWDETGEPTAWSEPAFFEMGLLEGEAWVGQWIGPAARPSEGEGSLPSPYLRRGFRLDAAPTRARLYVSALGVCEPRLNGQRVGNDELLPGWTEFTRSVQSLAYDVTDLLGPGDNVLAAILADGWYSGYMGNNVRKGTGFYGPEPRLLAQLEVETASGERFTLATDETWRWATGPLLSSDIFMGERYDARLETPGWDAAGFDDGAWSPVAVDPSEGRTIRFKPAEPIRAVEELATVEMTEPEPGVYIFDLGQNMVGRARLTTRGKAGQTVTLRYGEMLNPDGTLYTANLRGAAQRDAYTRATDGEETYEPRFTFHGFRYLEATGLDARPEPTDVVGVVMHNDMRPTGRFECSEPLLNQLQRNIVWGQRGNYLEVPTDCPQRDERLGWTGDAQVFARTAAFNYDIQPFMTKWLADVREAQHDDGNIPNVAPQVSGALGSAAWGDAVVVIPWTLYLAYGDRRVLERNLDAMLGWLDYCESTSDNGVRHDQGFGDWLAMDQLTGHCAHTATPRDLINTAYVVFSAELTARIAELVGRPQDVQRCDELAAAFRAGFNRAFVTETGRIVGDTQTAYVLALAFDLLPDEKVPAARQSLLRQLRYWNHHISTGFVGTNLLLPTLARHGLFEECYTLLMQTDCPSWLFPVTQGATTIWERWDGWHPDRGFQNPGMNSFNHYAYGAVGEWLYRYMLGLDIDPELPAYKHAIIHPAPDLAERRITHAAGGVDTPFGRLDAAWRIEGDSFTLDLTVPFNTTATVNLPADSLDSTRESDRPLADAEGLANAHHAQGRAVFNLTSGTYRFTSCVPKTDA